MAQHDLIIANDSGANVRSDLNNAFQALGSTSKGPTAPGTIYAGQLWVEDDNPSSTVWTLRVYDGADSIAVGKIDTTNNRFEPNPFVSDDFRVYSASGYPNPGVHLLNIGAVYVGNNAGTDGFVFFGAGRNGSVIGSISQTGGGIGLLFNTSSDYRLKNEVEPMTGCLERLAQVLPRTFKWLNHPEAPRTEGFIAHELAEVVPLAVMGSKDEVNPDGSIKAQAVDSSRLVPLLVGAVQELVAQVDALTARVQALDA